MPLSHSLSRASRTEQRLIDAARTLLTEGGVTACSMRAVARRSGVTPGAIYRHFRDKDALVHHVVNLAFEHFELHLLRAITSLPVGSLERLVALGEAYISFADTHPEEFRILFNPLLTERKALADLPGEGGYPVLRQCVVEAIGAGAVRAADPDRIALFLWTRVHGIVMLLLACDVGPSSGEGPAVTALELFRETREFMARGLMCDD